MRHSVNKTWLLKSMMMTLALTIVLPLVLTPNMALAKRGGENDNRLEFYGILQSRPENGVQGEWVIGGRIFIADPGTELDQSEGQLTVGSCAKVNLRNGRVHEIDSEPMRNCQ